MAYLQKRDFSRVISETDLNDLLQSASKNFAGKSSDEVLLEAINAAVAQVESMLSSTYETSLEFDKEPEPSASKDTREPNVVRVTLHIAVYWLSMVIEPRDIPELRATNYKAAIMELERVRDGQIIYNIELKENITTKSALVSGSRKFISKPFRDPLVSKTDKYGRPIE